MTAIPDLAEPGTIWVCPACSITARHIQPDGHPDNSPGWDFDCMFLAVLCLEDTIQYHPDGTVFWAEVIEGYALEPAND